MSDWQELDKRLRNSIDVFTNHLVDLGDKALEKDNMLLQKMLLKQVALSVLIREEETLLKNKENRREEEKLMIESLKSEINLFNQIIEEANLKKQ